MKITVNGTVRDVPFTLEEYDDRLKKLKEYMNSNGLEVLFITSPESLYYFSGYHLGWYRVNSNKQWNYLVPASIVVHVEKDDFVFYDIAGEEADVRESTVARDIRIFTHEGRPTYGIHGNAGIIQQGGTLIDAIVDNLKESGLVAEKVGIEMDRHGRNIINLITDSFSRYQSKTVDASDILTRVRQIKSVTELNYIEKSAEIADVGLRAVKEYLKPGVTENEVYAYATYKMALSGGEREGVSFIHGGKRAFRGHNFPSHEKLNHGDVIIADLFGSYQRYSSDLSRVFSLGNICSEIYDENMLEFFNIARQYHPVIKEKIVEILKPNMLINDFMGELKEFYQEIGIWGKQFWVGGYDMGILWPGDCCSGTTVYDCDMDKKDQRFVPGTAVNFETGFWVIDTLLFYEDKVVISGDTSWDIQNV